MIQSTQIAETLLFERFADTSKQAEIPMLFILSSPRTGSTLLYQFIIEAFSFYYFSNFVVEHFPEHPVVGVAIDMYANPRQSVSFQSNYGKTGGFFEPSEASWIFKNWFGGLQPSQTESARVLPEKENHMRQSLSAVHKMTGLPLVTKNAWNCFRVQNLCRMFPEIRFLWLRRDIVRSAISDLEARYHRGSPNGWNSATTSNYKEIQKLPYWEQVVEQQFEFNRTLQHDLNRFCPDGFVEVWYEDICNSTGTVLAELEKAFMRWGWKIRKKNKKIPTFCVSKGPKGMEEDIHKIEAYVSVNASRFGSYSY